MSYKTAVFFLLVAIVASYFGADYIRNFEAFQKLVTKFKTVLVKTTAEPQANNQNMDKKPGEPQANNQNVDKKPGNKLFTKEELWEHYRGGENSKGLYVAILGRVYDVAKGEQHYGPGGGYSFFAGRDGTRAFTTGDFTEKGLIDDLEGISVETMDDYENWVKFYDDEYTFVGNVIGNFYNANGQPTKALEKFHELVKEAKLLKEKEEEQNKKLPRCNSEWVHDKGSRVWCTNKSGGVERDWIGVPRQLHLPGGASPQCVCVRSKGPPTLGHTSQNKNRGDLDYPYLKEYENCSSTSRSCQLKRG